MGLNAIDLDEVPQHENETVEETALQNAQEPKPIKETPPLMNATAFQILTTCLAIDDAITKTNAALDTIDARR